MEPTVLYSLTVSSVWLQVNGTMRKAIRLKDTQCGLDGTYVRVQTPRTYLNGKEFGAAYNSLMQCVSKDRPVKVVNGG